MRCTTTGLDGPVRGVTALAALLLAGAVLASELDPAEPSGWALPTPDLYAVEALGERIWAAGYWGTVLYSADGGATWQRGRTPVRNILYDVSFADDRSGWAVGQNGVILRSRDGGETWTRQLAEVEDEFGDRFELDTSLFGVAAMGPDTAWAVGDYGVVLYTGDGETWEHRPIPPETYPDDNVPDRIFNAVHFSSSEVGWIAGEFGTVLRTRDGGATWVGERTFVDTPEDLYLFDLHALDGAPPAPAATVGLAGSVLVSADGGERWEPRPVDTSAGLFGVEWRGDRGIVVGDRGVLFLTHDGGLTWESPARPRLFNWLTDVAFVTPDLAFAVGEQALILRSVDGGRTWEKALGRAPPPREGIATPHPGRTTEPGLEHLPDEGAP